MCLNELFEKPQSENFILNNGKCIQEKLFFTNANEMHKTFKYLLSR